MAMTVKEALLYIIRKDMADLDISPAELPERVDVLADTEHYNPGEDESVWKQKKGMTPKYYEVYFDLVWVCDFLEKEPQTVVRHRFLTRFLKLYESGDIRLTKGLAKQLKEAAQEGKKKQQEEALKKLPDATPEQKAAKEIVTELVKEQNAAPK
jgi:hypothetical protein